MIDQQAFRDWKEIERVTPSVVEILSDTKQEEEEEDLIVEDDDEIPTKRKPSDSSGEDEEEEETQTIFNVEEVIFEYELVHGVKQVIAVKDYIIVVKQDSILIHNEERKVKQGGEYDFENEKIHKVFVNPNGIHMLVSMESGDNYYIDIRWKDQLPIKLQAMKDCVIESVGWDKYEKIGLTLFGTTTSQIYQGYFDTQQIANRGKEPIRDWTKLIDFNDYIDRLISIGPIHGIEVIPTTTEDQFIVLVATSTRLFQFIGGPEFEDIFDEYREHLIYCDVSFSTKIKPNANSEFHLLPNKKSYSWLTHAGILHGTYNDENINDDGPILKDKQLIEYDTKSDIILSIGITNYHTIVLFKNKVTIFEIPPELCRSVPKKKKNDDGWDSIYKLSILKPKIVMEHVFKNEIPIGITKDPENDNIFIYTDQRVYKLEIDEEQEPRNVWRLYLEIATDVNSSKDSYFKTALQICNKLFDVKNSDLVLKEKADFYFKQGKYLESADIYARTSKSFEQVVVSFYKKGQRDALIKYLENKLNLIVLLKQEQFLQTTSICTWLTELYLDKMDRMENNTEMKTHFRKFLDKYKNHLHIDTTFHLISSHGQIDDLQFFAMLVHEYERVISYFITEGEYLRSIQILSKYCKSPKYEEIFYKYTPILMEHLPKETVELLKQNTFLDPGRLIPAMMRYLNQPSSSFDHVQNYLEWCINEQDNDNPAIHNLLIWIYAQNTTNDTALIQFLNTEDFGNNYYDPKYALRTCMKFKQYEACVKLYTAMGLYDDGIELALNMKNIPLAIECANHPIDEDRKKKLWLRIARHVISVEKNVQMAIDFLKYTDKLKLEDLLPFLPNQITIEQFKEELSKYISEFNSEIKDLKNDMADATNNAILIRSDIKDLVHRREIIEAKDKCDAEKCLQGILTRKEFYLFPCKHKFHTDCLINQLKKHGTSQLGNRLDELEKQRNDLQKLRELDEILSNECPLCGELMIKSIHIPLLQANEKDKSWDLMIGNKFSL